MGREISAIVGIRRRRSIVEARGYRRCDFLIFFWGGGGVGGGVPFWLVLLPMRFVDLVRCVGMWVVEI